MIVKKNINSNDLDQNYYYTINNKLIKPNTLLLKDQIIEKHYRLKGGLFVESISELNSSTSSVQTILIKKGTYSNNFTLNFSNSSATMELIGGYIDSATIDPSANANETIIDGNLTIYTNGQINLKNIKITGTLSLNGLNINLNNIETDQISIIEANNIELESGNYRFNDIFFINNVTLKGSVAITTNGIHFIDKLICNNFSIQIFKTNDNSQPVNNNLSVPSDYHYADQYSINTAKIDDCWNYCDFSRTTQIVVAVIDTGVDDNHPDLINNFYKNSDGDIIGTRFFNNGETDQSFDDDNGHGTHVAGIIAAECDNTIGIAGVTRNNAVKIMPVKVLNKYDDGYYGYNKDIALGIRWAVDNGADIINLSLGGPSPDSETTNAIQYATDNNVLVVGAAGNSDYNQFVEYPGADKNVLCVGAIDKDLDLASFSSYKTDESYPMKAGGIRGVDLCSPGVSILSSYDDNSDTYQDTYRKISGTSMSTPLVAGIAALIMQQIPMYKNKPKIVRNVLLQSATDLGESGYDDKFGVGMVNALKALLSPWSTTVNDIDNKNQLSSNSDFKIINANSVPNNVNFSNPTPAPVSKKKKGSSGGAGLIIGALLLGAIGLSSLSEVPINNNNEDD